MSRRQKITLVIDLVPGDLKDVPESVKPDRVPYYDRYGVWQYRDGVWYRNGVWYFWWLNGAWQRNDAWPAIDRYSGWMFSGSTQQALQPR